MVNKKAIIAIIIAIIVSIVVYSFFFKTAIKQSRQPDAGEDNTTMAVPEGQVWSFHS